MMPGCGIKYLSVFLLSRDLRVDRKIDRQAGRRALCWAGRVHIPLQEGHGEEAWTKEALEEAQALGETRISICWRKGREMGGIY